MKNPAHESSSPRSTTETVRPEPAPAEGVESDPLWYKNAIIYELHVRAFFDSEGRGRGDFAGLTRKLDYLQELGVTALWLLPFYPSPLKDDGYDIADYQDINPIYGDLRDFKAFLREAHQRGMRVITELVFNHTSDQHEWFQRSRRAKPGSAWRDFYVWSDTPERYKDARIIFKDFESSNWTWDPVAGAYYWHRFYSHQPDLNFENPAVHKALLKIVDSWLAMGVDGLRLDAIPYLYEAEGSNCENLPKTHEFLKMLRRHVDRKFKDKMLLAEANQWPDDSVAYFGSGDECQMAFHFPLMPRLFMGIRMEDRFPIIEILKQTPAIPENCQWAIFLRNHDELTLEMVTDEERDYMYRVYAHDRQARINLGIRRRLAPLLGNDRRKIELMNALLFSLPGTPVVYYGDEIGMGDNIYLGDRNGVRTPMQWSPDRNAGFSATNPQRLYLPVIIDPEYHYQAVNVEAQAGNSSSLLWWTKRILALRKQFKAFGQGSLEFVYPENRKILCYVRQYGDEIILVVVNLSRFAQHAHLNLSKFKGATPVELFGGVPFPAVGEAPYLISLNPYGFYWFSLKASGSGASAQSAEDSGARPKLAVCGDWEELLMGREQYLLERILPSYMAGKRWFGGKARKLQSVEIIESVPMANDGADYYLVFLRVNYLEEDPETYLLPLAIASAEAKEAILRDHPESVIARLQVKGRAEEPVLYEAIYDASFNATLFRLLERKRALRGSQGELEGETTPIFRKVLRKMSPPATAAVHGGEQSNSSIVFGKHFILKLFRKPDIGINPEWEMEHFLTGRRFPHIAPLAGRLEYSRGSEESMTCAMLHQFVPNEGDAWSFTLDQLGQYFEKALPMVGEAEKLEFPAGKWLELLERELPKECASTIGLYIEMAHLLGRRTGEFHLAVSSDPDNPDFAPEPLSLLSQRSLYQSLYNLTVNNFESLKGRLKTLDETARADAERVLGMEGQLLKRAQYLTKNKIRASRIRCHGDYHLGQLLYTGKDFILIDFEGEPSRSLSERRLKRSPLRDVAGMIRSFHYAAYSALIQLKGRGLAQTADPRALERWSDFWAEWVSVSFLKAYWLTCGKSALLPSTADEFQALLDTHLLEKAVYELGYELNNRPDWVKIPLKGLSRLITG